MLGDEEEQYENEIIPEIVILRLHNGTDIMAFVIENIDDEDDDPHYQITSPLVVEQTISRSGKYKLTFKPWFWSSMVIPHQFFKIYHSDILTTAFPSETMLKSFEAAYNSLYLNGNEVVKDSSEDKVKDILDSMDNLEPSIKGNKKVKNFVMKELNRIKEGKGLKDL